MSLLKPPPDFVIVGAPKCGTTAVHRTLQTHPDIFLPSIKEPNYFLAEWGSRRLVETIKGYDQLFHHAQEYQMRGEASVMYLSSTTAIPAIMERRPDVKIIAHVRNPIDLFVSWHNQCLKALDEDITDPEKAWQIQEKRSQGYCIPTSCYEPTSLEYRRICSIGTQIERLYDLVPAPQRLIVVFDDLQKRPANVYEQLLCFLNIRDDGRRCFLRENDFSRPRSRAVAKLARSIQTHRVLKQIRLRIKPALNRQGIHIVEQLHQRNLKPAQRPQLNPAFRDELSREFRAEVSLLSTLLGRDLRFWLQNHTSKNPIRA